MRKYRRGTIGDRYNNNNNNNETVSVLLLLLSLLCILCILYGGETAGGRRLPLSKVRWAGQDDGGGGGGGGEPE